MNSWALAVLLIWGAYLCVTRAIDTTPATDDGGEL